MRIIAGRFKGRILRLPGASEARPTPDRAREALFSILGPAVAGASVLDLFAGSGAFGFEALSRGARVATFVERDAASARAITATASQLDLSDREAEVIRGDAAGVISRFALHHRRFGIVFADPPWSADADPGWIENVSRLVVDGGRLVIEFEWIRFAEKWAAAKESWDLRRYGRVGFAIRTVSGDRSSFDSAPDGE